MWLLSAAELFARFVKLDLGPALPHELQIHARGGEKHQRTGVIDGELLVGLEAELLEFARIRTADPARRMHCDGFEDALHCIFILQAKGDDLELQLAHGTEDQVGVAQRPEQLRRALLAKLVESLASAFMRSGSFSTARRNISGAKFGIPVKCSSRLR